MGWTEYLATHYKNGTVNRKAECDVLFDNSKTKVLKSRMVGSTYYADAGYLYGIQQISGRRSQRL